tara:strand:- start:471 stop:2336 length:1866 start_codon:yes stop_codon:yes gene_type:complete
MRVLAVSAEVDNWLKVFKAVNTLLDYGVVVLWSREEFDISGINLPPGTFIFPMDDIFRSQADENSLEAVAPLSKGELEEYLRSEDITPIKGELLKPVNVYPLTPSRVALYGDSGCLNHAMVLASSGFDVDWLTGRDIAAGSLDGFDILMSGGGARARKEAIERENVLLASMGVEGAKKVTEFVRNGGAYLGCCGGSYIGSVVRERFMNWWHPAKRYMTMMNVEDRHLNEFSDSGFKSPGLGVFTARNVAPENPAMFGFPEAFKCAHHGGPIFNLIEGEVEHASSATPLVVFNDVSTENFTPTEFQYKSEDANAETLKETGIYRACKEHRVTIAQGYYGLGLVVLSGSHPETGPFFGAEISRDELWESARILSNVALWAPAQSSRRKKKPQRMSLPPLLIPIAPQKDFLISLVRGCEDSARTLKKKSLAPLPFWLKSDLYLRSYGLTPKAIYEVTLDRIPMLCRELISKIETMDKLTEKVLSSREEITRKLSGQTTDERVKRIHDSLRARALEIIFKYYRILGRQRSPLWEGISPRYQGINDLLKLALSDCKKAVELERANSRVARVRLYAREIPADNPYSNLRAAMSRLSMALKLLWVHESAMERFLTLWRIFQISVESVN